jgi:hypothetical protein
VEIGVLGVNWWLGWIGLSLECGALMVGRGFGARGDGSDEDIASDILITSLLQLSLIETTLLQQICHQDLKLETTLLDESLAPTSTVDGSFLYINCKTLTNNIVK